MRVYVQIPHFNTELEDSTIRTAQAITYEPDELDAYRTLSQNEIVSNFTPKLLGYDLSKQDSAGLVREGFHEECFVEHAVGVLFDRNASRGSDRVCCNSYESIEVEFDLSLSKNFCLIYNEASTREFEELVV